MPRPKKNPAETAGEPATGDALTPAEAAQAGGAAGAAEDWPDKPKVKKTEMVRQAIMVGRKRKPQAIQEWVLEKFGVTISTNSIYNMKAQLHKSGVREPRKGPPEGGPPAPARRNGDDSLSVDEIRIVKEFMTRIGADKFCELVELLR
jgi:hypothetical protein